MRTIDYSTHKVLRDVVSGKVRFEDKKEELRQLGVKVVYTNIPADKKYFVK